MSDTYGIEKQEDVEPRDFYRCTIAPEKQVSHVQCGWSSFSVLVVEKSINGFTLLVKKRHARKFRGKGPFTLYFDNIKVIVEVNRIDPVDEDGFVRIAAIQTEDLTPPEPVKSSWWPSWNNRSRQATDSIGQIAFVGFVLILICVLAMPGLGEKLGTSAKIQNAFEWIITSTDDALSQ